MEWDWMMDLVLISQSKFQNLYMVYLVLLCKRKIYNNSKERLLIDVNEIINRTDIVCVCVC